MNSGAPGGAVDLCGMESGVCRTGNTVPANTGSTRLAEAASRTAGAMGEAFEGIEAGETVQQQSSAFSLRQTGPAGFFSAGAVVSVAWHAGTSELEETSISGAVADAAHAPKQGRTPWMARSVASANVGTRRSIRSLSVFAYIKDTTITKG